LGSSLSPPFDPRSGEAASKQGAVTHTFVEQVRQHRNPKKDCPLICERLKADAAVAERLVDERQQQVADTIIRAPFSGVVTTKDSQPGEMISPMSSGGFTRTGICTLVDMASLEIEVDVGESFINRVAANQPVVATLDAYPEWRIPGKVIAIIPTADRQKATVKVRVGFEKLDPRILPQMGVKVAFQSSADATPAATAAPALVVPKEAIRNTGGRDVAWVVREGKAERRAVTVSGTSGNETTVSAGLSAGETVVLNPPATLSDGAAVNVKESS
jgi:RND family efflux transporter MFP subunit